MKRLPFIILFLFYVGIAQAQERETLVGREGEHGGFGGFNIKVSQLKDSPNLIMGGKGAYLLDHRLYIGGGGAGTALPISINGEDYRLGYGGAMMGYMLFPNKLLHLGIEIQLGAGGVSKEYYSSDEAHNHNGDAFFFAEPSLYAAFNIAPHFQINTGVSYRYIYGVDTTGISDSDVSGITAEVAFLWGQF